MFKPKKAYALNSVSIELKEGETSSLVNPDVKKYPSKNDYRTREKTKGRVYSWKGVIILCSR